ncbi:ras guanine nucleotide exchange factor P-like [Anopheles merus]|uniref:ras guanine nucleotide exchange factor P-like n=1 Tax=Anopheles merus TaxID=30066 RepID=UPI001BE4A0C2|nr:ras guanine nucleotide exchange factor P-like [Anopheles merus]
MSKVRRRDVLLIAILVLQLLLALDARRHGDGSVRSIVRAAQLAAKVKRESGNDRIEPQSDDGDDDDDKADEIIYDQRQGDGETNIRLSIKNFQLQLPESELKRLQSSDMVRLIRNSVLRLFGIGMGSDPEPDATSRSPPVAEQPTSTERQPIENFAQSLPELVTSMLQVNGTNVPAKFFLEISDFLMNTNDNDAVDDMRVETNHNQQQQLEQQQLEQQLHRFQQQQQQQHHESPPEQPADGSHFGTEEITIERLENTTNVRNQTITISKKRHQLGPLPTDGSALETVSKENHHTFNTTRNATESSDRFVQTKPIRLETVRRVVVSTNEPLQTLREKVIWKVEQQQQQPSVVGEDGTTAGGH